MGGVHAFHLAGKPFCRLRHPPAVFLGRFQNSQVHIARRGIQRVQHSGFILAVTIPIAKQKRGKKIAAAGYFRVAVTPRALLSAFCTALVSPEACGARSRDSTSLPVTAEQPESSSAAASAHAAQLRRYGMDIFPPLHGFQALFAPQTNTGYSIPQSSQRCNAKNHHQHPHAKACHPHLRHAGSTPRAAAGQPPPTA